MTTAEIYQRFRPLMFSIAYRMLGSVSEPRTLSQRRSCATRNAARRQGGDRLAERPTCPAVTTRLCIDHLRSARARRESYCDGLPAAC